MSGKFTSVTGVMSIFLLGMLSAHADSLFTHQSASSGTLITTPKERFGVGDIVTVLVRESIDASTRARTDTKKESEVEAIADAGNNTFLTDGIGLSDSLLPNWQIEAENEHKSQGQTTRTNELVMTITCRVTEVYENGNIRVEGTKRVTINREDTEMAFSGIARTIDVTADNTITSNEISDATIDLKGKGPLWNNQRRGWLTKILDWFSPF